MRTMWMASLAMVMLLALPALADQISGSLEDGYDRPGGDYDVIDLDTTQATQCFSACARDDRCLAWTYVKPGVEAAAARCHLKDSVSVGTPDPCCTSGVMNRAGDLATLGAGSNERDTDPDHPWSQLREDGAWCSGDILATGYRPLFVQLSDTRETIYVFTNPAGAGYVGLSGCDRIAWNWSAFHEAWVKESIDYPDPEDDSTYSKKILYRHLATGEHVTIAYLR
jgi:hypothetical protein